MGCINAFLILFSQIFKYLKTKFCVAVCDIYYHLMAWNKHLPKIMCMCAVHLALCYPTLNVVIQVKMVWSCGCRLRYEAGGRPNSYNNNCDTTQRLSGNSYGEIQQGSKLDDQLAGTKNQVSVSCIFHPTVF
jgi:hypothetical protein